MGKFEIRFKFEIPYIIKKQFEGIFEKIADALNIQFDEELKPYVNNKAYPYEFRDVSSLSEDNIKKIMDSFFNFTFNDIINVPLYRFLVLKTPGKLTVLANIHSLIFDYTSINTFYKLFNAIDEIDSPILESNIISYYDDLDNYLNSSDFKNDCEYWNKHILEGLSSQKLYNLKSENYRNIKASLENEVLSSFLNEVNIPKFNFILAIFSLYLSRIDRTNECLLKTFIPSNKIDLGPFDKETILKIEYSKENSFDDYLNEVNRVYNDAAERTITDIDNYFEDDLTYYSINDFSEFEDISILNGNGFALTLNLHKDCLELVYNADLFSDVYIEHMMANIMSLIDGVIDSPNQRCCDIDIVSSNERALISDFCHGNDVEFDKDKNLALVFRENAKSNPNKLAIDDGVNKISYGQLEMSSNSIAYDLRENHGIDFANPVGLILPRTYHFPELVLSLNKIGVPFVPIDAEYPIKRIKQMVEISESEYIITTKDIAQNLDLNVNVICIEDLNSDLDCEVEIKGKGDDLFAIMFTSGTSGIPKGVMIPNKQLCGLAIAFKSIISTQKPCDTVGSYSSFSFTATDSMLWALYFGNSCRIFNEHEKEDFLVFMDVLEECPLHSIILPAVLIKPILDNHNIEIDCLVSAGSKITKFSSIDSNKKLFNAYGLTEAKASLNICNLGKYDFSCGKPLDNTWVYILDENSMMMPIGVPGEICISTDNLSKGYVNNPKLTSEKYVDNPYCNCEYNKKLYKSGDIGFYNFEGNLEIIGRDDDQLSLRGFRIESDEIINIMNRYEAISNVCLDVDNDSLIAYYTTNDDLDIEEVKDALKSELPKYMIPSLFIKLEEIPLNVNGKIDKLALKDTSREVSNLDSDDEILKCVVGSFKEVLNTDSVLLDDDFVSLGGNSLSALKLQLLLKERLNVHLFSNEIMNLSTPNRISNYIKFDLNTYRRVEDVNYTFDEGCPLSDSQLNVYLDEEVNDKGTSYNNPFIIRFNKYYSTDELKKAITELMGMYPILKSRVLIEKDSLPMNLFDAEIEINEGSLDDIEHFVRPFDLDKCLSRFLMVEDDKSSILCCDFHHMIFDGTSLNILLDSLVSLLNNEDVDFTDNGILRQVSFEKDMDSHYIDDAQKFLDNMLADRDEVYDLLPCVDSNSESVFDDVVNVDESILTSFLKGNSITHNQFFTSVFAYSLSKFAGSSKVLFNLIENGRGHMDLSNSVGMFVRTLPLLLDCKNQSVSSFLKYSSNTINSLMEYDLYPFHVLANEYDLNSDILFQYSHDIFRNSFDDNNDYHVDELKHESQGDMSFFIYDYGKDQFAIKIKYSDKFSYRFIKQFAESYKLILQEMICKDKLDELNYISESDLEILDNINKTHHNLDYNDVLDAFNDNLSEYPDNNLVSMHDRTYSYGEGAYIAHEIAEKLLNLGVEPQNRVAFLTERSEYYMFAILGILSIGAVFVPLDDNHPNKRLRFMMDDADVKVVIGCDETYNRLNDLNNEIPILNISDILKKDVGFLTELPVSYGQLASILYTSGTTGVPKGVMITRKSILNVAAYYVDTYGLDNNDVYALYPSIGFDAGSQSVFKAIYAGACLSIVPEEIKYDMTKLNEYFIKQNVTHTIITTPVGKLFMQNVEDTSLKYLFVGGEKLGEFRSPENYQLVDEYGPTEGNNFISSIKNSEKLDSSSIGWLNYNSKAYILDGESRRVPLGAVGELCISGYQIANGYLNREEETQKSFVDNPFDDDENYKKLYHTGDLVRLLPDDSLAIVGRRDGQVKIRGNRVELSEIESVIREIDYVDNVTVQIIKNGANDELVAYLVVNREFDDYALKEDISDYVGKYKPDYMIPSFVIKLDEIPLNINGKIDRNALPKVDLDSLHSEYVAPSTENEKMVVEAFEKIFNRKIGLYDDFTVLGGNSLTAIKLLQHLDGPKITAADVLTLRTPYAISKKIKDNSFDLDLYNLEDGCPLSESQLNVYLDIIANNKMDSYIIPVAMNISKDYSAGELCDALRRMIEVHPILGMCVSDREDVPHLVKGEEPQILVKSDVDDGYINEFKTETFDLTNSLCRFLITENDGDAQGLTLYAVFHHLVFDGLSIFIFEKDLQSILEGEDEIGFDDSFLKVSRFNKRISETEQFNEAHDFFSSMLADYDEAGVLLDDVDSNGPGSSWFDLSFDNGLFNKFLDRHNISENVLFTSVFAYTLSRFTGSDKVLFNIIENGRDRFNNYDSIGMFVNTMPMIVDCKSQEVSSFMNSMFDRIYNVMKYNYYPFRFLANEYGLNLDVIFQFKPDWFKNNDVNQNTDIIDVDSLINDMADFISDFVCEVIQMDEDYRLRITYSDKYSDVMIKRFSHVFNLILSQIIVHKDLDKINYIPSSDLELLESYNETEKELKYNDILDAFLENLSKYSNNKLVSMDDRSYTYGEGAYIINEIVSRLNELNVKSQDNVSFLVDRSEWYLFVPLAILSMGCVYVPLDDAHPDERIRLILEDSKSKVVIATDETYERAKELADGCVVLNVSDILSKSLKSLTSLNGEYGDLACILYTSGTTGVPKGVKITRKAILNASSVYVDKYAMGNDDVYGFYVSIGFDIGSLGLWATICAGASLVIVPEEIKVDVIKLNDYFVRHNVTYSAITAQVAKLFIQNIKDTSLKVLSVGGEKLGQIESPDYQVMDEFGPTEAFAFVSSVNSLDKIDLTSVGSLNYNTKAYVLDNERRRVPFGAAGELYLAGHQIAEGYLNRDEETANSFIANPFEDDSNYNLLYRTGDMVRLLPDGSIAILGRRDRQVKIRGNRVELPEIEVLIRELDYVNDVTVQTIKNGTNNELVAYVVLSKEIGNVKDYICNYVGENKPNYMVPSFVVSLDEIPLTVNGKVDTARLPQVDVESEREYEYPESFIEKAIANGFSQVLNISRPISRHDEFNALGGDSISVMMLVVKLREINLHVSVKDVLENQSVRKIAEKVEYKLSASNVSQKPFEGFVNQTPITSYFWDLDLKDPSYFNQALLFECSEKIDRDILRKAMQSVVNHHDILRSKVREGRLYVGEIDGKDYFTIDNCNSKDYRNETERINRGIDIVNGPLIKLGIFEEENADYLYIAIHHLIVDGISWRIIPEDLNLAYMQLLNGDEISLPTKTNSYQDYALAIDEYKNSKQVLKQKTFWENILNDLMNVKHTKIGKNPRKMQAIRLKYSKEKTSILFTNAIKEYNASINGLFLSAIVKAWKNVTGDSELSIRVESHGREDFDDNLLIERTVGWFSSCYPLILKCNGDENGEIVDNVEKMLADVPQNGFAYPVLMGIETDLMPLLTFNYLGEINGIKTGEMFVPTYKPDLAPLIAAENDFSCDININGYSIDKEPIFELRYNSNRFNQETMEQFANEILKTLDELVEYCDENDYSDDMCIFSSHPNKKNLFIIHSANFGSEFFYYLAEQLKDDYSVYVIEPYNLNHMESPLTSVEEFAQKYIQMIKSIQPEGPYYLGGFCFGGSIAHEMSIELKKQNEEVDKLIIFDANNIEDKELQKLLIDHQILHSYNQQQGGALNPKGISVGDMAAQAKIAGSIWLNYRPKHYDGETLFFKSSIKPEGLDEDANKMYDYLLATKAGGYEDYYDDEKLTVIDVPVEHNRIFSDKGLEIIIPEMKKFIGNGDL